LSAAAAEREFNAKIFECIDKALGSLGEGVKQSFYHQMKNRSNLTIDKFATRPKDLIENLRQILGVSGSTIVEKLIIREVRAAFGLQLRSDIQLEEAISDARNAYLVDARDKEIS
jgi:hypothetical protein